MASYFTLVVDFVVQHHRCDHIEGDSSLLTPDDVSVKPVIKCEPPRVIPLVPLDGRDLNHGGPKGKESGDPMVPARGIVTGHQGRRILLSLVMGGRPGSCSLAVRYPVNYESRAFPRVPAR